MIWLAKLLDLISGPIAGSLADAYKARQEAKSDQDRIAAEERISTLEAQSRVHGRLESVLRALIAAPFIVYLWKLIIWDKLLKLGVTDSLSTHLWNVFYIILGFYFVRWTASKLAK
ncbi:MAG: hypothetical protein ABJO09_00905 [Hyphomicrobiales bacterium]